MTSPKTITVLENDCSLGLSLSIVKSWCFLGQLCLLLHIPSHLHSELLHYFSNGWASRCKILFGLSLHLHLNVLYWVIVIWHFGLFSASFQLLNIFLTFIVFNNIVFHCVRLIYWFIEIKIDSCGRLLFVFRENRIFLILYHDAILNILVCRFL